MAAMVGGGEIKCLKQRSGRVLSWDCRSYSKKDVPESRDEDNIERIQFNVFSCFVMLLFNIVTFCSRLYFGNKEFHTKNK